MLYKFRRRFKRLSESVGRLASKLPLSPNGWTLLSILVVGLSLFFLIQHNFLLATGLLFLAASLDFVDGAVARATGYETKFGGYLDTVVDRLVDGIIIIGLIYIYLPPLLLPSRVWAGLFLLGTMLTSYVKAAAHEKIGLKIGEEIKGGILERAERLLLLVVFIGLASLNIIYLTYGLALLAILTNISALQRFLLAKKVSK